MSSVREIAESIARRGLPFSAFIDGAEYESAKKWITSAVEEAIYAERVRCANIVNNARFDDGITDLRELVSRIRTED